MLSYCDKLLLWDKTALSDDERRALHSIIEKIAPAFKYALGECCFRGYVIFKYVRNLIEQKLINYMEVRKRKLKKIK